MGKGSFFPGNREPVAILREPVWERQLGESRRAFECFRSFLDQGALRTVTEAYRQYRQSVTASAANPHQANGSWNRWASRWRWNERADAFDAHLFLEERRAQEAAARAEGERIAGERRAQRKRELDVGDLLLRRAEEMLQMPVIEVTTERDTATGKVTQTIKPGKWRVADTARMLEVAVQLRRLALDMDTSRAAVRVDIEEEVRQLARANGWDEQATVEAANKFAEERGDRAVGL